MSPTSAGGLRLRSPRLPAVLGIRTAAPFIGGMVTDLDPAQLHPQQSPNLQDVIFPTGVSGFRGALTSIAVSLTSTTNVTGISVTDGVPPAAAGTNVYHWGLQDTHIQNSLGGTVAVVGGSSPGPIPYVVFQNEVLWFSQDGVQPIVRTPAQPLGTGLTASGTLTAGVGTTAITGAGTSFLAYTNKSCYLSLGNQPGLTALVVFPASDTSLSIATPTVIALSGQPFTTNPFGRLGLCVVVAEMGTSANAAGTVTGQGTDWTHSGPGYGQPSAGVDYICANGAAGAWQFSGITAVTSGGAITATGGTWTAGPYRILRQLVGTHGCVHNGRLIVVGCQWQRRRVFYTPLASSTQVAGVGEIPWTLGDPTNGNLSWSVQPGDANVCPYVDVPDQNTEGQIIGVASTASGILVLATDGAYLISGDFPNETIVDLSPGADCVDARSIVSAHGSVFWAGLNGIFQFTGGRVVDITSGKRNAEWRRVVVGAGGPNATLPAYFVKNHYCVSVGQGTPTWVYDAAHAVWCGNHTTTALAAYTMPNHDEAYVVPNVAAANQKPNQASSVFLDGALSDSAATFIADLPPTAAGDSITDKRVTGALVRLSATGTVTVQSAIDGPEGYATTPTYNTDGTITGTGITSPTTTRIRPTTDSTQSPAGALGVKGRKFQMRITCTNAASASVKVNEIEMFVRTFAENR